MAFWRALHGTLVRGEGNRARVAWRQVVYWAGAARVGRWSWREGWFLARSIGVRVVLLGDIFDRSYRNRVLEAVLCSWRSCAPFCGRLSFANVWIRCGFVVVCSPWLAALASSVSVCGVWRCWCGDAGATDAGGTDAGGTDAGVWGERFWWVGRPVGLKCEMGSWDGGG